MKFRRLYALCGAFLLALSLETTGAAQGKGASSITPGDLKDWLSYIASDELQGRQVFTEGLGLAGGYIAEHLKAWGVKPAGDNGTYFQVVKLNGVTVKRNSSVTVTANGQTKTFKDGEGVTFNANAGGKQTVTGQAEFVGYGLSLPDAGLDDYKGRDVTGKIVLYIGRGPQTMPASAGFRVLGARARNAIELKHAAAAIGQGGGAGRGAGAGRGGSTTVLGDFQTVERLDRKVVPQITAGDEFFDFIFTAAGQSYADIKAKADKQEALPAAALASVSITIDVDNGYEIVQTRLSHNVVGVIEGSDPKLRGSYVLFGAHYDHTGDQQTPPGQGRGGFGGGGNAPGGCTGQQRDTPRPGDNIYNGADDDGSGTVGVMAIAKAFATGPKPKRSLMLD